MTVQYREHKNQQGHWWQNMYINFAWLMHLWCYTAQCLSSTKQAVSLLHSRSVTSEWWGYFSSWVARSPFCSCKLISHPCNLISGFIDFAQYSRNISANSANARVQLKNAVTFIGKETDSGQRWATVALAFSTWAKKRFSPTFFSIITWGTVMPKIPN